jgi:hypothetical protein
MFKEGSFPAWKWAFFIGIFNSFQPFGADFALCGGVV